MKSGIVLHESLEQQELTRKRREMTDLQEKLIDRTLFLEDLRARLCALESRYLRKVGILYAELDDWSAKIAELAAEIAGTEQTMSAAAEARRQAEESYAAAHGEAANTPAAAPPSPELERLFREVARQIHPDCTIDEADRVLRNRLMAEANLARERGDAEMLRQILEEYKRSPESVKGQGFLADLERIQRQIDQIIRKLSRIESEIAELLSSELALLMAKVESAAAEGRDLLAEMAKDVSNRIRLARAEFEAQSSRIAPR